MLSHWIPDQIKKAELQLIFLQTNCKGICNKKIRCHSFSETLDCEPTKLNITKDFHLWAFIKWSLPFLLFCLSDRFSRRACHDLCGFWLPHDFSEAVQLWWSRLQLPYSFFWASVGPLDARLVPLTGPCRWQD